MDKLLSFLFYTKCVLCNETGLGICKRCLTSMSLVNETLCPVCFLPSLDGKVHISCFSVFAPYNLFLAFNYTSELKKLFLLSTHEFYALKVLTRYGCLFASTFGYLYKDHVVLYLDTSDSVVSVFIHAVIAKEVAKYFGLRALAYSPNKALNSYLKGKAVLLVLPYVVTGEELVSVTSMLYQNGAQMINCFVLTKKVI